MKKKLYYQFAASCCLLLFIFLGYVVKFYPEQLIRIDHFFSKIIHQNYDPALISFFKIIAWFGKSKIIIFFCILFCSLLIWKKKYLSAGWLFLNTAIIAGVGSHLLKFLFMRRRPLITHLVKETSNSFPSEHAMESLLFYGTCIILIYYLISNQSWQVAIQLLLGALILTIGWSLVSLGIHSPTDIFGGYLFGLAWIWFSYPIFLKQRLLQTYKKQQNRKRR